MRVTEGEGGGRSLAPGRRPPGLKFQPCHCLTRPLPSGGLGFLSYKMGGGIHQEQRFSLFHFFLRFTFRERRREGERERNINHCLLHAPYWGPDPQPRRVSSLGIEPVTFWFAGQGSIHGATPARASPFHVHSNHLEYF